MDLRTGGVIWSNLNFICQSNITGRRVNGHLELDDSGVPKDALYTLSGNSDCYYYEVNYYFTANKDLPDYMPSRITITFLGASSSKVMSDYKILKLAADTGELSISDVALAVSTNTQEYIYTNKTFFHIKTNEWVRIGSSTEIQQSGLKRKQIVTAALAVAFFAPVLYVLFKTLRNINKNK